MSDRVRTPSCRPLPAAAFLLALVAGALIVPVVRADAAPAVALPDTGLFAPVAAQQAIRLARIERLKGQPAGPRLVDLLLASGRPDEAAKLLDGLKGDPREIALVRARTYLARGDFEQARPLVEAIAKQPDPTDAERRIRFAWLDVRDDAAAVDSLTRGVVLGPGGDAPLPDLIAAGTLAYDLLDYARADSCFSRVVERTAVPGPGADEEALAAMRSDALVGLGKVAFKRRDYDGAFARAQEAVEADGDADALEWMGEALIRLGRTDEAISADEWGVRLDPYHEMAHYFLGNGYARRNYTQLWAAYPGAFADSAGRAALALADRKLDDGDHAGARAAYAAVRAAHPGWADVAIRLASLDFEEAKFAEARDLCFDALALCPEYGRAHATLAKALESRRFEIDVHRPGYERRFAAMPMPDVPGIETFVLNWKSLSPRHRKRVALSIAPWKQFLPVLVAGGATYYIKPLYMLLSETPGQETLRDLRINYDSRLWDDVRGCGGYHTVTGVEDVERTIFDRYNTVLHELTHQVHAVLTADQDRVIQNLYVQAKARDDSTHEGFLSRYASGSVYEYLAEGANALYSPRRDRYDPREVVRERLDAIDPALRAEVEHLMAQKDVSASYPVAFTNAGDDEIERGRVDPALAWYEKALARAPDEEGALLAKARALTLGNRGAEAVDAAARAVEAHPSSGPIAAEDADALWHGGRGLAASIAMLDDARPRVRAEDRYQVDLALARLYWVSGDAARALAASDSVLAYQSDQPEGLWRRAAALALAKRWDEAFAEYKEAVRLRTGVPDLRADYARDLLRAGRVDEARAQLDEAKLLDEENPTAEALRGWVAFASGDAAAARAHCHQALTWGPWCDLARIVAYHVARAEGSDGAEATIAPLRERITKGAPPEYVYRPKLASWESVHELPAVERALMEPDAKLVRAGAK